MSFHRLLSCCGVIRWYTWALYSTQWKHTLSAAGRPSSEQREPSLSEFVVFPQRSDDWIQAQGQVQHLLRPFPAEEEAVAWRDGRAPLTWTPPAEILTTRTLTRCDFDSTKWILGLASLQASTSMKAAAERPVSVMAAAWQRRTAAAVGICCRRRTPMSWQTP